MQLFSDQYFGVRCSLRKCVTLISVISVIDLKCTCNIAFFEYVTSLVLDFHPDIVVLLKENFLTNIRTTSNLKHLLYIFIQTLLSFIVHKMNDNLCVRCFFFTYISFLTMTSQLHRPLPWSHALVILRQILKRKTINLLSLLNINRVESKIFNAVWKRKVKWVA